MATFDDSPEGMKSAARRDIYTHAQRAGLVAMADDINDIADSCDAQYGAAVNKARLQVDARKWLLSKLLPAKYGDKVDVQHAGQVTLQLSKDDAAL